jgi:hypothetical protein
MQIDSREDIFTPLLGSAIGVHCECRYVSGMGLPAMLVPMLRCCRAIRRSIDDPHGHPLGQSEERFPEFGIDDNRDDVWLFHPDNCYAV